MSLRSVSSGPTPAPCPTTRRGSCSNTGCASSRGSPCAPTSGGRYHCPPQNPARNPSTTRMRTEIDLRRLSTPVPRCDGRHMVASPGSPIQRHPNIRVVHLDLAAHVMLTVRPVVTAEACVPARQRGCSRPPARSRPRSRHRPAEGAGRGAPSRPEPCPAPSPTPSRDTSPSSSPCAAKFALTLRPRLQALSFSLVAVVRPPVTADCQNAIDRRATCRPSLPPAVNPNCCLRRSRAPTQSHYGLAHDAALPFPLTLFLCTTPAHGAAVRHAGLTGRSCMTLLRGPDGGGGRARMLTPAPCAARSTAQSLTKSTSSTMRTRR